MFGCVQTLHKDLYGSDIYKQLGSGQVLRGTFVEYPYVSRAFTCGTQCFIQEGFIGFTVVSYVCNVVLGHPGPNATYLAPDQDTKVWMRRYPGSCLDVKFWIHKAISGKYRILIPGTHEPVEVYCDMTTASGGWTLVWSYGFTICEISAQFYLIGGEI